MSGPEEAELHFLAAIRYSPHHVNAHYNLGQVYRWVPVENISPGEGMPIVHF